MFFEHSCSLEKFKFLQNQHENPIPTGCLIELETVRNMLEALKLLHPAQSNFQIFACQTEEMQLLTSSGSVEMIPSKPRLQEALSLAENSVLSQAYHQQAQGFVFYQVFHGIRLRSKWLLRLQVCPHLAQAVLEQKTAAPIQRPTAGSIVAQIDEALEAWQNLPAQHCRKSNHYIVQELYERGVFQVKGSVNLVADRLRISKHTVYLYLRKLRRTKEMNL